MFCTHCGNEVDELSLQCPKCGCNPQNGHNICPRCGASVSEQDTVCLQCSYPLKSRSRKRQSDNSQKDSKSRIAAGIFALFFGTIGVHQFYLGNAFSGILRIVGSFMWIFILIGFNPLSNLNNLGTIITIVGPFFLVGLLVWIQGIIEGINYLTMSDEQFDEKYVQKTRKRY